MSLSLTFNVEPKSRFIVEKVDGGFQVSHSRGPVFLLPHTNEAETPFRPLYFKPSIEMATEIIKKQAREDFHEEARWAFSQSVYNLTDLAKCVGRPISTVWNWFGLNIPTNPADVAALAVALDIDRDRLEFLWRRARKIRVMKKGRCVCMPPIDGHVRIEMLPEGAMVHDAHGRFLLTHEGVPVPVVDRPPVWEESPDTIRWLTRLFRVSHGLSRRDFQILMNVTGAGLTPLELKRIEKKRQDDWNPTVSKMAGALGVFRLAA